MKNAEGFKFMKAGQQQRHGGPRNVASGNFNNSQRSYQGENSGGRNYGPGPQPYQQHRPSFDHSQGGGSQLNTSTSARKLQPWSSLGAAAEDHQQHHQKPQKRWNGDRRRPSDFINRGG